jgi:hypothetical protein
VYKDPNTWTWEREIPGRGEKFGGRLVAAWVTFGFSPDQVRAGEHSEGAGRFSIRFEGDRRLIVEYKVRGMPPVDRTFVGTQWQCTPEGLLITVLDRTGQVLDKLPNHGHAIRRVVLRRTGEHLYVRVTHSTKAVVLGVVPESFETIEWQRFVQAGAV